MGSPSSDNPEIQFPVEPWLEREQVYVPPLPPPRPERLTRYIILFLLTLVTTTLTGADWYGSFLIGFSRNTLPFGAWELIIRGLWYSLSVLAILGAHEFGHYYACRYYRVDVSLPYFLPMPFLLTGTLGAFIRIRQPIPGKRALFDIGIAGPIAGFLVAIPVLFIGMYLSRIEALPETFEGAVFEIGEPLLFKAAAWLTFGSLGDDYTVNMHPMAFVAWFGMLATALNLFPFGQLDGGHISYAVLGRKSTAVSMGTLACLVGLSFVSSSWIAWTVLMLVMLVTLGPRHPRTFDDEVPLDSTRLWLAAFAVLMFVLCFTPAPIEPLDLVTTR